MKLKRLIPRRYRIAAAVAWWLARKVTKQRSRQNADIRAAVEHVAERADAALVVNGSADSLIAQLVAAGWSLSDQEDRVSGKRVRFLSPPGERPQS